MSVDTCTVATVDSRGRSGETNWPLYKRTLERLSITIISGQLANFFDRAEHPIDHQARLHTQGSTTASAIGIRMRNLPKADVAGRSRGLAGMIEMRSACLTLISPSSGTFSGPQITRAVMCSI